jgi:hypothetical protein
MALQEVRLLTVRLRCEECGGEAETGVDAVGEAAREQFVRSHTTTCAGRFDVQIDCATTIGEPVLD